MTAPAPAAGGSDGGDSLKGIASSLTKKVGPLPAWVWAAIAVGGVVAYSMYAKSKSGGVAVVRSTNAEVSDGLNLSDSPVGGSGGTAGGTGYIGTSGTGVVTESNASWAKRVTDGLIGLGVDPAVAANAVTKYLAGGTLSAKEGTAISTALTNFGSPAEGVLPVNQGNGLPSYKRFGDSSNPNAVYRIVDGAAEYLTPQEYQQYGSPSVTSSTVSDNDYNLARVAPDISQATAQYYRDDTTGEIYSVIGNKSEYLTPDKYTALGRPAPNGTLTDAIRDAAVGG